MTENRPPGPKSETAAYVSERDFSEQMMYLGLTPEELRDKYILVLGPGGDWSFEQGARTHGAALVVAYSIDFSKHDPLEKDVDKEIIKPVRGRFQNLPPGKELFDLVVSSFGFPMYATDGPDNLENLTGYFSSVIDLIAKNGRGIFFPVRPHERRALEKLAETRTDFTYHFESDERLVIEKR